MPWVRRKDLVFHTAVVEDCWLHEEILRDQPVIDATPAFEGIARWRPVYADFPLEAHVHRSQGVCWF